MFKYTESKLAKDLGRVAKSIDPTLEYSYLPDTCEVKLASKVNENQNPHTIFLGNIYLKISTLPRKERIPAIEAFLRDVLTSEELSPDEFMGSLALRVRTDFEVDYRNRHIELMGHDVKPTITLQRGELLIEVVSDRNESVSVLPLEDLAKIGASEKEAIGIASARIRRATDEAQWEKLDESIWMSSYQDDYDFARLIAAEEFGRYPFEGPPIVFAPSHSVCLATDCTNSGVLSIMTELGYEAAANHRPFCELLWTLDKNGEWKQWQPGQEGNAKSVADLQVIRETAKRYEETKDYLERSLGEDVFVATYQAMQNDDGLTCYSVYTLDLPSYLPQTEFVAIVDSELPEDETVLGRVDWREFIECIGSGVKKVEDMKPLWYRITQPLDEIQKDRLRQLVQPI